MTIQIENIGHITKIANLSGYDIELSIKPVKPKRTYILFSFIAKGTFHIYEFPIDMTKISISFHDTPKDKND